MLVRIPHSRARTAQRTCVPQEVGLPEGLQDLDRHTERQGRQVTPGGGSKWTHNNSQYCKLYPACELILRRGGPEGGAGEGREGGRGKGGV